MLGPLRTLCSFVLLAGLAGLAVVPVTLGHLLASLPSPASLREVRFGVPLRVYTRDGLLLAEFGSERRDPVPLDAVPETLIQAVVAAEDARFFEHPGVDWEGLARATLHLLKTGEKGPGGSTITMQVARAFFLGREKTFTRKLNELLLALKIERELSKREILELYLNQTFFGQRAYGVAAAAQVYYGRGLADLSLPEIAVIAGLPQAPSRLNPIADPDQALRRRNYVLRRMHETGAIDAETYRQAAAAPLTARLRGVPTEVEAPHVAEMVRAYVEEHLGEDAYASGVRVYTTLDSELQTAALRALRDALIAYDTRHGYRGPEDRVDPAGGREAWAKALEGRPTVGDLLPAVVVAVEDRSARLEAPAVGELTVRWEGLSWARRQIDADRRGPAPRRASDVVSPGDVVRVRRDGDGWRLAQVPEIQGALVALDPSSGAIRALVGGLEFERSQFNRAIQAQRQPGSSFKPFIYSAALERGYTAGSILLDEPFSRYDPATGKTWEPENYDGKFKGPTRLREALVHSRNVPSIRLLEDIGVDYAISHGQLFGFDAQRLPRNLSLALGTGTVSPLELASAYCVFANGGFRVEPHFIELIQNEEGQTLFAARPALACPSCPDAPAVGRQASEGGPAPAQPLAPRVLDPRTAWVMSSILGDVIRRGTGRAARVLERGDIAGKTGTTNDFQDAWFAGYSPTLAVTTWVGFDQLQPLGKGETGGHAALPMWIDFMRLALAGQPEAERPPPPELTTVPIDPVTGEAVPPGQEGAVEESFPTEFAPVAPGADPYYGDYGGAPGAPPGPPSAPGDTSRVTEALF